jgi:hypothetical protein
VALAKSVFTARTSKPEKHTRAAADLRALFAVQLACLWSPTWRCGVRAEWRGYYYILSPPSRKKESVKRPVPAELCATFRLVYLCVPQHVGHANFCFSAGDMDARFSVSEAPGLPIGKAEY